MYRFKVRLQFVELKLKIYMDISDSNFLSDVVALQLVLLASLNTWQGFICLDAVLGNKINFLITFGF